MKEFNTPWTLDYDEELSMATIYDSTGNAVLEDITIMTDDVADKLEYMVEAVNAFHPTQFTRNHIWERVYQNILDFEDVHDKKPEAYLMNRDDYSIQVESLDVDKIPTRWQYKRDSTTGQVSILGVPIILAYQRSFESGCISFMQLRCHP